MHLRLSSLITFLLVSAHVTWAAIYVSPHGSVGAEGTRESPTTLPSAFERAHDNASIDEIILLRGRYSLKDTLRVRALVRAPGDSLTIRSESADHPAVIQGGASLYGKWSSPASDDSVVSRMPSNARGKVRVADLRDAGITDYGTFKRRGFAARRSAPGELFVYGRRQPIAGYPNPGQWAGGEDDRNGIENGFQKYASYGGWEVDLPDGVAQGWHRADEIWAHGYWGNNWADAHLPVTGVENGRLALGALPASGFAGDGAYRVYNLPEELDSPGEWYLHRKTGILYFWPKSSGDLNAASFSLVEHSVMHVLRSRNLRFENLIFETSRSDLVRVVDSTGIVFRHCEFRGSGEMGLRLDGERNRVEGCHFHDIGDVAIELTGGDRDSLRPGANLAVNNVIHDYGQVNFALSTGIFLDGVGNVAAHNLIYDAPQGGIQVNGILGRVYRNEIHNVCSFVDDGGAIYSGRNFIGWGNEIVENFVHDIKTRRTSNDWVHAIYLDDFASGFTVRGNVIEDIQAWAINLGGGRYNIIDGNLILDSLGGHLNDNRGAKWINTTSGSWWNMLERLSVINRFSEPWKTTFPGLAMVPDSGSEAMEYVYPDGSRFTRNAGDGVGRWTHGEDWTSWGGGVFSHYAAFDGTRYDASVSSGANLAGRSSRSDISIYKDGIKLPFSRMGVHEAKWTDKKTTKSSVIANFSWNRGNLYAGSTVKFHANSWAAGGDRIVSRTWSIDGTTVGEGEILRWTFPSARRYLVSLRIVTASGASDRVQRHVVVRGSGDRPRTWLSSAIDAPGIIQAEYFDHKRYFDTDSHNAGGAFRSSGVDIAKSGSTTFVGWTQPDEWLEFTVEAPSGMYDIYLRAASRLHDVALSVQWDGAFVAGKVLPNVGNNMNFKRYKAGRVNVSKSGLHTLRIDSLGKDFNLDNIELVRVGNAIEPETGSSTPQEPDSAYQEPDQPAESTVTAPADLEMGAAAFARYDGIPGDYLNAFLESAAFPDSPDSVEERNSFEFRSDGENFGLYAWGWIVPEKTGYYTFWIASDNDGVLSLSPDRDSTKARVIGRVYGHTKFRGFDERGQQRSGSIFLEAGKAYYIEALTKQGWGGAHLSVAWEGPGFSRQIIPGRVLGLPSASAVPGTLTHSVNVAEFQRLSGGSLDRLYDSTRYPDDPDRVYSLSRFSYHSGIESLGAFAWAWVVPESTGYHTFWIAADDEGELFFSPNGSPDDAQVIARVNDHTRREEFTRYTEQKSAPMYLEAGKRYYIAVAMKQGWGDAHFSVAWKGPGFSREVIPGRVLTAE